MKLISGQNELYHTSLLLKKWYLPKNDFLSRIPFRSKSFFYDIDIFVVGRWYKRPTTRKALPKSWGWNQTIFPHQLINVIGTWLKPLQDILTSTVSVSGLYLGLGRTSSPNLTHTLLTGGRLSYFFNFLVTFASWLFHMDDILILLQNVLILIDSADRFISCCSKLRTLYLSGDS